MRVEPTPGPDGASAAQASDLLRVKLDHLATEGMPLPASAVASRLNAGAERLASEASGGSLQTQPFPADRVQPQGAARPDESRLSDARSRQMATDAATNGDTVEGASTGALWGAVEPCWRNLGFRGQAAVVIDVELDARGGLRRPPTVVRAPTSVLSEPR